MGTKGWVVALLAVFLLALAPSRAEASQAPEASEELVLDAAVSATSSALRKDYRLGERTVYAGMIMRTGGGVFIVLSLTAWALNPTPALAMASLAGAVISISGDAVMFIGNRRMHKAVDAAGVDSGFALGWVSLGLWGAYASAWTATLLSGQTMPLAAGLARGAGMVCGTIQFGHNIAKGNEGGVRVAGLGLQVLPQLSREQQGLALVARF